VRLLSKDFLRLVGVAFVIAAPLAYYGTRRWLQDFAYRIDLGVGWFALAGGLALVIAFLTVSTQAWRAAQTDPTQALQQE
jgi:putative ABC transport system permease protein